MQDSNSNPPDTQLPTGKITIRRAAHDRSAGYFLNLRSNAQDYGMTLEALGMLTELLSRPGDWKVKIGQLTKRKGLGRDRAYRVLNELIESGHVVRQINRDDTGKVLSVEYTVFEDPTSTVDPLPEKPDTVKPDTANQDYTEYRVLQSTDQKIGTGSSDPDPAPTKTKTGPRPRSEGDPDPMYEGVESLWFGSPGSPDQPYDWNGRLGQIVRWLKGEIGRVNRRDVGKISKPATLDNVRRFVGDWKVRHGDAALPLDPHKFVEQWRGWAASLRAASDRRDRETSKVAEYDDRPKMTPEQARAIRDEVKAGTNV